MIKSKVETQSGKWNEFVPKCRQANKLKKAKTLFTATFLTELEFTGWRTELCNKFTCAQYDVISVCTKFRVVDNISPSLRYQPFYVWDLLNYVLCAAGVTRLVSSLTTLQPRPFSVSWLASHSSTIYYAHFQDAYTVTYNSSKAAYSHHIPFWIDYKHRL